MKILKKNVEITNLSNFRIMAYTKYYYEINRQEDVWQLIKIIDFCKNNNLKYLFIWWWTNLLFAFEEFNWVIIKNNLRGCDYNEHTKILEAYSSESLSRIALKNQEIWHRFIWLPWTIWWAVFWNSWCFWLEIENNFLEAEVLNLENWKIYTISKKNMKFAYRDSILKQTKKYFLIKVKFDMSKNNEKFESDIDILSFRKNNQPVWNTCWSFFKNPTKEFSAWKLIEEVWLKWYKIWWAYFSEIHANFLMNDNWNYKDLLKIINLAQKKVKLQFWIKLVPEVNIIYN